MGWQPEEHEAAGVAFEERWRRLDDAARACRALWSGERVSFQGATAGFRDLLQLPAPVQRGGVPLWLGAAASERSARRMAEWADGWMPMESGPAEIRAGLARIRAALRAAGRDPSGFGVRAHAPVAWLADRSADLERTLAGLPALAEAGVTVAAFALAVFARRREEVTPFLKALARLAGR